MLEQIINSLPEKVRLLPPALAMGISAGGLILGLVGARLSRAILTLTLVAVGTIIGMRLPQWFGWKIDPMGTAFGAAIVLGLSGYVLNVLWEGLLFGGLLAMGAAVGVWQALAYGSNWHWPAFDDIGNATVIEVVTALWKELPESVNRALPLGAGLAFAIGVSLLIAWPQVGRSLLYSALGMGAFVLGGAIGLLPTHPDWLARVPKDGGVQAAMFGGLVLIAASMQWLMVRSPKTTRRAAASENDSDLTVPAELTADPPLPPVRVSPPPPPKSAFVDNGGGPVRHQTAALRPPRIRPQ